MHYQCYAMDTKGDHEKELASVREKSGAIVNGG
jgi:hypothetical protein